MIEIQIEDYYIPMKDFDKYAKERERYLNSIDKECGTQFTVKNWKQVMKKGDSDK